MAEGKLEAVPMVRLAPEGASAFRRFLAFVGPGYMVAVGYMDPGNWATDLEGGARYGYTLLCVILLSNLMAVLLQSLSARLGIATGHDLAQACRTWFPTWLNWFLWATCEIAIIACDLAEVIGTAVALQLLFGFSLFAGALLSVGDVFLALLLMRWGFRLLEAFVMALLGLIALCFAVEVVASHPAWAALFHGFLPNPHILTDPGMLYLAIGIIGATVMPHNLYLHSSLVKTRAYSRTLEGRREALRWARLDSGIALTLALGVNAAILIVAAAAFHGTKYQDVAELSDAWKLLSPVLGFGLASTLFAVALLAAGTNSTVTGTLAGQIVMEGFLHISLPPWLRRLLTRGLAVIPVLVVIGLWGDGHVGSLLVFSQVVLSLQLPFAVIPLVMFTCSKKKMGTFVLAPFWQWMAWGVALVLVILNGKLLYDALQDLL